MSEDRDGKRPSSSHDDLVTALRVLHREIAVDTCCDPPMFDKTCEIAQRCAECFDAWPCATTRLLPTPKGSS